jgi:DNA-binding NarL/FixJ family response regulator
MSEASSDKITVLVADDHEIVRYGICSSLQDSQRVEVVAQASDGESALQEYKAAQPDVAVIDISMPDQDGISTTESILKLDPEAKVLILTMYAEEDYINKGLSAGALGYVLKNTDRKTLVQAIEQVAQGNSYFSNDVSSVLAQKYARIKRGEEQNSADLTAREVEILTLISEGMTSQQIAEQLHISPRTVDTHRSNLMQKVNVNNTAALVRFAIKNDLV